MQLISIAVYNRQGERRDVGFRTGRLNIVTGGSKSGKSALLDIVEYCLGRDTIMMPIGPITATVVWYAALFELPGGARAFVGRPAPREGAASTQQAMLEFGSDLDLLPFERLVVNSDTRSLREQLGRRIGIEENLNELSEYSLRSAYEANLGHAALLCFQGQGEIADRAQLFHRQAEQGIDQAIKDTLPYFLGAMPSNQALRRVQLREARRELARIRGAITSAEAAAQSADGRVRALAAEAGAVGLIDPLHAQADRDFILATLELASRGGPDGSGIASASMPNDEGRQALELQRRNLHDELHVVSAERRLLLDAEAEANSYGGAVSHQMARLVSLDLIPLEVSNGAPTTQCPLCSSDLPEPDASIDDLRTSLDELRGQLATLEAAQPTRRLALGKLEERAATIREELRVVETAIRAVMAGDDLVDSTLIYDRREFTRGRINAMLEIIRRVDDTEIAALAEHAQLIVARIESLQSELDDDEVSMRLDSRLLEIAGDMTAQSSQLSLEHPGRMRLDLGKLTVITETNQGPAPLWRIGSAENWIGAHLIAHLSLHKFFTLRNRPVPRFLMLDQPTQAWYPSEVDEWDGIPVEDSDKEAVRAIFQLLLDVVTELAPDFQVIVCDHANLPEPQTSGSRPADQAICSHSLCISSTVP